MSDTMTGLPAGFGGFATTPAGELTYMNRQHNPYAFLQQDQTGGLAATAPAAAEPMLATGGLANMTPQQHIRWARLLNAHAGAHHRMARQKLDDGGDAGPGNSSNSDSNNGGASGGTNGPFGGADAPGNNGPGSPSGPNGDTSNTGQATTVGGISSPAAGMNGMIGGMTTAGQPSSLGSDPIGMSDEASPSAAQLGFAAAKGAVGGMVPGLGLALGASGLSAAASNALGIGAMGPGATMGSQVGTALGGALGGPAGAGLGAALGAEAGAHGASGSGMGGTSSNAGVGGANPSGDAYMPTAAPAMQASGQGEDIGSLIQRIRAAMGNGSTGTVPAQSFSAGGHVGGPVSHSHFHTGSGLVQSASDGRADAVQTTVPRGTYVVPADVVSGLGQGNTMAGAHKLGSMLRPVGHFASGGTVPVRLSGGEFVLHPAHVAHLGGGSLKAGSDKLDTMVGHVRRINAAQVSRMPPPR